MDTQAVGLGWYNDAPSVRKPRERSRPDMDTQAVGLGWYNDAPSVRKPGERSRPYNRLFLTGLNINLVGTTFYPEIQTLDCPRV